MLNGLTYKIDARKNPLRHHQRLSVLTIGLLAGTIFLCSRATTAADRYAIAPLKSRVRFQAYSLFANPVGTLQAVSGEIVTDSTDLSRSHVHLRIDAASVDTANAKRDRHLRGEDFFFVAQHPTITFVSTAIRQDDSHYVVVGDVQIRGVSKRITFPVTVEQTPNEIVIHGRVGLNRQDFGMTYNAFFNPLRDAVDVMFTIVGVQQ